MELFSCLDESPTGYLPTARIQFQQDRQARPMVKITPDRSIVEKFLELQDASDEKIFSFASKYGPLLAFSWVVSPFDTEPIIHGEATEVWRYLAGVMWSMLKIATGIYRSHEHCYEDWERIANMPPAVKLQPWRHDGMPVKFGMYASEKLWVEQAGQLDSLAKNTGASRLNLKRASQARLVMCLNLLLRLGQVDAKMIWPSKDSMPSVSYAGSSLLGFLALQISLRITKADGPSICSHCSATFNLNPYQREDGRRVYCQGCVGRREPQKLANRKNKKKTRDEKQKSSIGPAGR